MTQAAVILTYHAIEDGPAPLCIDSELFRAHLDALAACGAQTLTITQLVEGLRRGSLPKRAVAITFDDGAASVARDAAPLLLERGLTATVYCVAGHLGGTTDWPTQPADVPGYDLSGANDLAELARAGIEIGSHGFRHAPLAHADAELAREEIARSKAVLEEAVGSPVTTFACPYGSLPGPAADALIRQTYDSACATGPDVVRAGADVYILPRVDAHYVRRPALLRGVISGSLRPYVRVRRLGSRARRLVRQDYVEDRR